MTTIDTACSEGGCGGAVQARGLCNKHYKRRTKDGTLPPRLELKYKDPAVEFWARVHVTNDCWEWRARITEDGYGNFSPPGPGKRRTVRAHRWAFENLVGEIPRGLVLDHLCRNRACVNPGHLEPVTNRENLLRGIGPPARNAAKTSCHNGHAFDEANTAISPTGRRRCRACNARWAREYRAKRSN